MSHPLPKPGNPGCVQQVEQAWVGAKQGAQPNWHAGAVDVENSMGQDKSAEVTRKLKRVAEEQFLRIMEEADRVDPDRSQSTTTAYRRMALSAALDAAIAALKPIQADDRPPAITRDKAPTSYRLMKKTTGEMVLQG